MNKILAGDFTVLAESPDPDTVYTGSPCLAQLPSGRLIASYEWFRPQPLVEKIPDQLDILVSDDDGSRWRKTAVLDIIWPSLFAVDDALYCIGNRRLSREIIIARSEDGGESWSNRPNFSADAITTLPPAYSSTTGTFIARSRPARSAMTRSAGASGSRWW